MKAAYHATKPSECWDWLTVHDVHQLAGLAWKFAKASSYPPRGQRWMDDGVAWSSPADFVDTFTRLLVLQVQARAFAAGIPGYEYAPAQLSAFTRGEVYTCVDSEQAAQQPVAVHRAAHSPSVSP